MPTRNQRDVDRILNRLDWIQYHNGLGVLYLDQLIRRQGRTMALDLSELTNEVTTYNNVSQGILAVVARLADEVEANADNPAALAAIVAEVRSNNDALAAGIVANTPVATEGEGGGGEVPVP